MKKGRLTLLVAVLATILWPSVAAWAISPSNSVSAVFPEQFGAIGNGITDDTKAIRQCADYANRTGRPIGFDRQYRLADDTSASSAAADITLAPNVVFYSHATIQPDEGVKVTLSANVSGPSNEQIFTGAGVVDTPNAKWVSVAWWGAMAQGADAALGFRQAMGNNRTVFVPPGNYVFKSTQSSTNVLFDGAAGVFVTASNFKLYGYGATIQNASQPAGYSLFLFSGCRNFQVAGLRLHGTQKGDVTSIINYNGFSLFGVNGFRFVDLYFSGNWSAYNATFDGDWIANGSFEKIKMDNLGMGFDFAYVQHCKFDSIVGRGIGATAECLGNVGLSIIHDESIYARGTNKTGLNYSDSNDVTVTNCSFTNLSTGYELFSGYNYHFQNNHWNSNPGSSQLNEQPGYGAFIGWLASTGSKGFPPHDIQISGDTYNQNGAAVATDSALGYGCGIWISAAAINNSDVISNICLTNCQIINNDNSGINSDTAKHIKSITLSNVTFGGAQQTASVGANLLGIINQAYPKTPDQSASITQKSSRPIAAVLRRQARGGHAQRP